MIERSAPRYTPAGLPALDLLLQHASEVHEDGQRRKVSLELRAVAIGESIVRQVGAVALGAGGVYTGFLGAARNGRGVVFHVTSMTAVT